MNLPRWLQVYLLPGIVFQAVLFGGAYGTGREIVEFVTRHGRVGGLLALGLIALLFSLILILTFECARQFKTYDYRTFFQALIGRGWLAYEVLFVAMLLLVLAVNLSAAEIVLATVFHANRTLTLIGFVVLTVLLLYAGTRVVEVAMLLGVVLLALCLGIFAALVIGGAPQEGLPVVEAGDQAQGWALSGFQYALYNSAAIPVLLYSTEAIESRRESMVAGLMAGIAGVAPAFVLHLTFIDSIPMVLDAEFPVRFVLQQHQQGAFLSAYALVLYSMILLTAVGLLHGMNRRIGFWLDKVTGGEPRRSLGPLVSGALILLSLLLAKIGLITLIARGYGSMAWGFLAVYLLPLMLRGVRIVFRAG